MRPFIYGQLNRFQARRIQSQLPENIPGNVIDVRTALDVLPPELLPQFSNLREQPAPESQQAILDHTKYGRFSNEPLSIGLASTLVLRAPSTTRIFLFIVNTHATQNLFLSFGSSAAAVGSVPILANFGVIGFDTVVPQDDIYLIANGAATTGTLVYSNKEQ